MVPYLVFEGYILLFFPAFNMKETLFFLDLDFRILREYETFRKSTMEMVPIFRLCHWFDCN